MPAISSLAKTGNAYIDGVLTGTKWAVTNLTFSFPTDPSFYGSTYGSGETANNFEAFNSQQQETVRKIFNMYSSVINIGFTEVTETSAVHGDLRFAESDSTSTGWGYYPSTSATGGDTWFNNSKNLYDNPIQGNYAYLTMMHEIGHALGLKHPHEVVGSFGSMPADKDSLEYTVMSYKSYVGSTGSAYTNGSTSYPQTLMMYDIAALQTMYGADFNNLGTNLTYSWNSQTGEMYINGIGQGAPAGNKIFMTVWDGGANSTYDFSNYAIGLQVNLNPGEWTTVSATQLASLGNSHFAIGNIANALPYQGNTASLIDNAIGGAGHDIIIGNVGNNNLTGRAGNDTLDGGAGTDTAWFSGLVSQFAWVKNLDGSWTITDLRSGCPDGIDILRNIENLGFADDVLAIEGYVPPPIANNAPQVTSSAPLITLTEWADKSADETANTLHNASGTIAFTDADAADSHIASFTTQSTGYLGVFSLKTANIDNGTIDWTFAVDDKSIDYLKAGQSLSQTYTITIDDGHGGTAAQSITITLAGADDATTRTTGKGGSTKGKGAHVEANTNDIYHDQAPAPTAYGNVSHDWNAHLHDSWLL